MELPKSLSPSAINRFLQCPFQWRCSFLHLPAIETDTSARDFGSAIHKIIDCYYTNMPATGGEPAKVLDEAIVECGSWITDKHRSKTKKFYANFLAFERQRLASNTPKPTTEIEFGHRSGQLPPVKVFPNLPPLAGIIDCYLSGVIIDWKTGAESTINNDHLIQGQIYTYLMKSLQKPVLSVFFYFLMLGVNPKLPQVTDSYVQSKIAGMCEMISKDQFPTRSSHLCSWCAFQLRCYFHDKEGWLCSV